METPNATARFQTAGVDRCAGFEINGFDMCILEVLLALRTESRTQRVLTFLADQFLTSLRMCNHNPYLLLCIRVK